MSIFLNIKDLMLLEGIDNYNSAQRRHKCIRESFATGKRKLTIGEYCKLELLDYREIYKYLRGEYPP